MRLFALCMCVALAAANNATETKNATATTTNATATDTLTTTNATATGTVTATNATATNATATTVPSPPGPNATATNATATNATATNATATVPSPPGPNATATVTNATATVNTTGTNGSAANHTATNVTVTVTVTVTNATANVTTTNVTVTDGNGTTPAPSNATVTDGNVTGTANGTATVTTKTVTTKTVTRNTTGTIVVTATGTAPVEPPQEVETPTPTTPAPATPAPTTPAPTTAAPVNVTATNATATNATVPVEPPQEPPQEVETPAPAVSLNCTSSAMCAAAGDGAAICDGGVCVCSTGYAVPAGEVLQQCFPEGTDPAAALVKVYFSLRFADGDFASLTPELRATFTRAIELALGTVNGDIQFSRGSIIATGSSNVKATEVATKTETSALTTTVLAEVAKDTSLTDVFGSKATAEIEYSVGECVLEDYAFAVTVVPFPEGSCTIVQCEAGYDVESNACIASTTPEPGITPRGASEDSDNTGVIAGAIIGTIAGVALIGGLVYFVQKRNRAPGQDKKNPIAQEFSDIPQDGAGGAGAGAGAGDAPRRGNDAV